MASPMGEETADMGAPDPPQPAEASILALPYVLAADGKKQPLPGAKSIFIRGGTADSLGLAGLSARTGQLISTVPREKLLADIQFQGAISDFHCIKDALKAADYDDIAIRVNEDDVYGDGNNYEVAVTQATVDAWRTADGAAAEAAAAATAAQQAEAQQAPLPRSKRKRERQPWVDQGTEAELEAAGIFSVSSSGATPAAGAGTAAARELRTGLLLSKPRRAFGAALNLVDAPASELWASNTMEARPFKDTAYETKLQLDTGVQAVPRLRDVAIQASAGIRLRGSTQTVPQQLPADQLEQLIGSQKFHAFLQAVQPRLDEALLQNAVADILADDLQLLGDEENDGIAGRAAAGPAGTSGRQEHGGLTEAQSFTDLTYSKNKVVSAICWVPNRRGVIACACTDPASQTERLATNGRLSPAYILVWNFKDPIHPEYVLESPHEVFSFQYNPHNPDIVIGGCYNGQIVVWETDDMERLTARQAGKGRVGGGKGSAAGWDDVTGEEAMTPVIRHKYLSAVEHSHTSVVSDVCWLPGIEVDRTGKVFSIRASSAGTSAQALLRSMTLGAAAKAAVEAGSNVPRDCCFFASIAADGKVLFWDVRVDKLLKKGNKRMDETELVWRPMHTVHLLSVAGNDFAGTRFCFDPYRLDSGNFTAGSMDGEILTGNFIRPVGEENPDYTRCVFAPHVGPLVALQVSPFLPEVLLSVGDWSFKLWQGLESKVPVFVSPYADEAYTAAAWSPSRPGLLFLATSAGSLHVWDMLDRSHEPSLRINMASSAITAISFSSSPPKHAVQGLMGMMDSGMPVAHGDGMGGGSSGSSSSGGAHPAPQHATGGAATGNPATAGLQVLAVGDASGMLHLFELPRTLRRPLPNEKKLMAAFVAREAARVADVADRHTLRAAALKQLTSSKGAAEDTSSSQDQHITGSSTSGGKDAAARASAVSHQQAGTLAAAPAGVISGSMHGGRRASKAGDRASVAGAVLSAAELAELEAAEKRYRELEAEFKQQLGLI